MTGTASTEAQELESIYSLTVARKAVIIVIRLLQEDAGPRLHVWV